MEKYVICALLLTVLMCRNCDGCSCLPAHPQTQYCKADFVIIATPVKRTEEGLKAIYKLTNVEVLKASNKAKTILESRKIYTGLQSAACGVFFELNKKYIITGSIYGGRAEVNLCGYSAKWSDLSEDLKTAFLSTFKKHCTCDINFNFGNDPVKNSPNSCVVDSSRDDFICYVNHGICSKNEKGTCEWMPCKNLKKCLRNPINIENEIERK